MKIFKGWLPSWTVLFGIGGAGLLFLVVPHYFAWDESGYVQVITEGIGVALLTACILGFTIDRWMKAEIARDVFSAALGYMLPAEFKREVSRIIGFKLLCENHEMHVHIDPIPDTECVRVTISIERKIRNISATTQTVSNLLRMDEWGFDCGKSRIETCDMQLSDGTIKSAPTPYREENSRILADTEPVALRPGDFVTIQSKFSEIRRINDRTMMAFQVPTMNPTMEITAPSGLVCTGGFGSGDPIEESRFKKRYTMDGTYFPGVHMQARWYPEPQQELQAS